MWKLRGPEVGFSVVDSKRDQRETRMCVRTLAWGQSCRGLIKSLEREVGVPSLLPRPDGILKEHGMGVRTNPLARRTLPRTADRALLQ